MGTYIGSACAPSSADLTTFKAWGRQIYDALTSLSGWTQTSDTGQVDWSTISSVPTAPNTVYQVWRMSDSLASSSPFYLRYDVGPYSSSTTGIVLKIRIGTGSNGSGTLTGNVSDQVTVNSYSTNNSNTAPWWFSAGDGYFGFISWVGHGTLAMPSYFGIERSRNASGVMTEEYASFISGYGSTTRQHQTVFKTGSSATVSAMSSDIPLVTFTPASGALDTTCFVSPVFPIVGKIDHPQLLWISCKGNDINEGTTFGVTLYGTSHTYKPTKAGYAPQYFGSGTNNAICIRWE